MVKKVNEKDAQKLMKDLIGDIEKKYGSGSAFQMSDNRSIDLKRESTGSLTLDGILGGGLPVGRILEIYGPESSGKTTVSLLAAAEIQRKGGRVAFIDAEHAFNPEFAKKLGVKDEGFILSQPDSGEQAFSLVEEYARSGLFDLIIVDSVSALVPKDEIEGDMGDAQMGKQARMMGQGLRKITGILNKTETTCIFINQLRAKIGVLFGSPETTSGGNALKFFASIRIDTRKGEAIKDGKEQIGHKIKIKTKKNKTFPPFKNTEISLYYDKGFDAYEDIIDAGRIKDIIKQAGAYYTFTDKKGKENKFQGKAKLIEFFKSNEKSFDELKEVIQSTTKLTDEVNGTPEDD